MNDDHVAGQVHRKEVDDLRQRIQELEAEVAQLDRVRVALREEGSFRKGVIEHAAEGICVCHDSAEFPFVEFTVWNSRMEEITGYSMEEINRRGWYQSMYPDAEIQERARARMDRMRVGDNLQHERWEITCADGSRKPLGISTSILTTEDGLTHVLGLMLDVTNEERYRSELEHRVATLEGILPICATCKKIRDEKGNWQILEKYISDHSDAVFSHGICADCMATLYPDV